jgi:hypothetical protein
MSAKNPVLCISLFVIAFFAGLGVTRPQTGTSADVIAAITKLENDAVKADLTGDTAFYQKVLADDWTRGDSDGTFTPKPTLCAGNRGTTAVAQTHRQRVDDITRHQRLIDDDPIKFSPKQMLAELCVNNQQLTGYLRSAHALCDQHCDVATASLIEPWLDEAERRIWFLSELLPIRLAVGHMDQGNPLTRFDGLVVNRTEPV